MFRKVKDKVTWWEALRGFLEQWGLWSYATGAGTLVLGIAWAVWHWFVGNIPLWAAPIVLLALASLTSILFFYCLKIWRLIKAYRKDLPALGERLIEFSQRFARSVRDYERSLPKRTNVESRNFDDSYKEWQANAEASKEKLRWLAEAWGGELMYFFNQLHMLDIELPFHLRASIEREALGVAAYLHYAGMMLKEGRLEELQNRNSNRDWLNSNMFSS